MKNITIKKQDVNSHFENRWQDFYSHFIEVKASAGKYNKCLCPLHGDLNPSLSFHSDTGLWKCFGCKKSGDAFKFYGFLKGISDFKEILQGIGQDFGINGSGSSKSSAKKSRIVTAYDYVNEESELIFQSVRFEPKDFKQRRPNGKGGWIWNLEGVQRCLYGLPAVLQAELVLIPEGEKDSDNLKKLGFIATTSPGGAEKWEPQYSESLAGRDVILLPDSDEVGFKHVQKIANSLKDTARSIKVLELPGLKEKQDVSDWIAAGGTKEELEKKIAECPPWEPKEDPEEAAKKLFPRRGFPWEVLPVAVATSLKQLARSCASSPTSLPGAAVSIFASILGSTVSVSPKRSWQEPLIFWMCDIRPSGSGKTPAARALCNVLYQAQSEADEAYKQALDVWESLLKKERGSPPDRPRGYFVTDLTLEGLRSDHSGHGGKVCVLDELSAFLSSQNQYKAKRGSDRESWLCLHDGKPARIVRAKESLTLSGARISIFGGVQPGVWQRCFGSEQAQIYLIDGTIFRFLPTFEGESFYPLTAESWSDENREEWEGLLRKAMNWTDDQEESKILCLSEDARQAFLDWRNELYQIKEELPAQVQGFVPKITGYALRWAGALYLMHKFSQSEEIGSVLQVEDIKRGIKVSQFYLGHVVTAIQALTGDLPSVYEITDQVLHLAKTLDNLRKDLDSRRLAVGFIQEKYNKTCKQELKVRSPHLMGSMIRRYGLTILPGVHDSNGRRAVKCLIWDEKIISFIESCLSYLSSLQSQERQGSQGADNLKSKSELSAEDGVSDGSMQTMQTTKKNYLHTKSLDTSWFTDNADNADKFSKEEKNGFEEAPELIEI